MADNQVRFIYDELSEYQRLKESSNWSSLKDSILFFTSDTRQLFKGEFEYGSTKVLSGNMPADGTLLSASPGSIYVNLTDSDNTLYFMTDEDGWVQVGVGEKEFNDFKNSISVHTADYSSDLSSSYRENSNPSSVKFVQQASDALLEGVIDVLSEIKSDLMGLRG